MIVKNEADALRFIEEEGLCGVRTRWCSQSCEEHGAHVAVGPNGKIFAVGASTQAVLVSRKMRRQQLTAAA